MKVYIAGPWLRKDAAREARAKLLEAGIECTSRWIDFEGGGGDTKIFQEEAINDMSDVRSSDALLLLNLQKRGEETSGKATETGMALALEKKVVMVGEPSNIFHYLPEVIRCSSVEEAIKCLLT